MAHPLTNRDSYVATATHYLSLTYTDAATSTAATITCGEGATGSWGAESSTGHDLIKFREVLITKAAFETAYGSGVTPAENDTFVLANETWTVKRAPSSDNPRPYLLQGAGTVFRITGWQGMG